MADAVTNATLQLHREVAAAFLPTAVKFHYQWNLRELSSVFQGLTLASAEYYDDPFTMARLWVHEVQRTYGDRLSDAQNISQFDDILTRASRRTSSRTTTPRSC